MYIFNIFSMFLFLTLCSGFWTYLCFCRLQNMVTHRPSPRFSVEQLGIGKVVVYFLTAISVAIIWTIIHHVACFPFSSLDVGMCLR